MTSTSTEAVDYSQYSKQKVTVTVVGAEPNSAEEMLGYVETGNALGLLFRPAKKTQFQLIEAANILEVFVEPVPDKKVQIKSLGDIKAGAVRQHVADRHGIKREILDALSEDEATTKHAGIDHSGLYHNHDPKPVAKAADIEASDSAAE
jgi:hypothetical protein